MEDDQDHFNILREIQKKPNSSQRELAKELGFSLGKLNYCLKALQNKGLIKNLESTLRICHCWRLKLSPQIRRRR